MSNTRRFETSPPEQLQATSLKDKSSTLTIRTNPEDSAGHRPKQTTAMGGSTILPSIPPQDLTSDALISNAPRAESNGSARPCLGGIPLLAKLGQGGMGAVYYGIHPRLNKEVAVKVLPLHLAQQQPAMVQRFFREAQIAANIQSPHLVSVSDVNSDGGIFYLVMEFVPGKSAGAHLRQKEKEQKPGLSEAVALDICIAATEGLAAAHAEEIIHRDIKPDNIMIPKFKGSNELNFKGAKLMDLGLARGEESGSEGLTAAQVCMGTPGYMAPEQATDAKNCGKPADVFSMGATFYALLCGDAPFTGSSMMQVLLETAQKPHTPIKRVRADVSQTASDIIECCLSKFSAKRFTSAATLLDALRVCRDALGKPASGQQQALQQIRELMRAKDPALDPSNQTNQIAAGQGAAPASPASPGGAPALQGRNAQFQEWQARTMAGGGDPFATGAGRQFAQAKQQRNKDAVAPATAAAPAKSPPRHWNATAKGVLACLGLLLIGLGIYWVFKPPKIEAPELTLASPLITKDNSADSKQPSSIAAAANTDSGVAKPDGASAAVDAKLAAMVDKSARASQLQHDLDTKNKSLAELRAQADTLNSVIKSKKQEWTDFGARTQALRQKAANAGPAGKKQLDKQHDDLAAQANAAKDAMDAAIKSKTDVVTQIGRLKSDIAALTKDLNSTIGH